MSSKTRNIAKDGSSQAIPQYYNPTADLYEALEGSNGAANMQLTGSNVPDVQPLPFKRQGKTVTIANAVAINDTIAHDYALSSMVSTSEIQRCSQFKVSLLNTADQSGTVSLYTKLEAAGGFSASGLIYTEANNLLSTSGKLLLQEKAGGTGSINTNKAVPCLGGIYSDLYVRVQFSVAPTTGSVTIKVEMQ